MNGHWKTIALGLLGIFITAMGWFLVDLHGRDTFLLRKINKNTRDIATLKRGDIERDKQIDRLIRDRQ